MFLLFYFAFMLFVVTENRQTQKKLLKTQKCTQAARFATPTV